MSELSTEELLIAIKAKLMGISFLDYMLALADMKLAGKVSDGQCRRLLAAYLERAPERSPAALEGSLNLLLEAAVEHGLKEKEAA